MSAEATAWVWRCSPYRGVPFVIHLAIADVVNDVYGWEMWMSHGRLATKARTRRATVQETIAKMCVDTDGVYQAGNGGPFLEVLDRRSGDRVRYRFLMPPVDVAWDPADLAGGVSADRTGGARPGDTPCTPTAQGGVRLPRTITKGEQKGTEVNTPGDLRLVDPADVQPTPADKGRDVARLLFDAKAVAHQPRPATPFPSVAKIAATLIDAGHKPSAVLAAMMEVPTISTKWVEAELARQSPRRRGAAGTVDTDRDAPEGRLLL